jgi:hypothetical protein
MVAEARVTDFLARRVLTKDFQESTQQFLKEIKNLKDELAEAVRERETRQLSGRTRFTKRLP